MEKKIIPGLSGCCKYVITPGRTNCKKVFQNVRCVYYIKRQKAKKWSWMICCQTVREFQRWRGFLLFSSNICRRKGRNSDCLSMFIQTTELRIDIFFSKHHKAHSCEGVESEESRIIGASFEVSHTCVDKQVVALLKYAKVTSTFCRSRLITTPILSGQDKRRHVRVRLQIWAVDGKSETNLTDRECASTLEPFNLQKDGSINYLREL